MASLTETLPTGWVGRLRGHVSQHGLVLWLALLAILTALFIYRQGGEVARGWAVLRETEPGWMLAVVLIEAVNLSLIGLTYRALLQRLGHRLAWPPLVAMHLERIVVGTVTPVGGPPSLYVMIRRLGQRGVPADDALLAAGLRSVANYASFLLLLIPAVALYHPSRLVLLAAALVVGLFAVVLAGLAYVLGGSTPKGRWSRWLPRRVLGFLARVRGHGVRAADLARPFALVCAVRVGGVAMLYASLRAAGEEPSLLTPLIAYAVGLLFLAIAPVFQGVGVVEASMAIALQELGVPGGVALAAALLTRIAELWLPLGVGLVVQVGGFLRARTVVAKPAAKARPPQRPAPRPAAAPRRLTPSPVHVQAGSRTSPRMARVPYAADRPQPPR